MDVHCVELITGCKTQYVTTIKATLAHTCKAAIDNDNEKMCAYNKRNLNNFESSSHFTFSLQIMFKDTNLTYARQSSKYLCFASYVS